MSVLKNSPRKSPSVCSKAMRQQGLLCWRTRGACVYSTCLARGEISFRNKSHRYREITVLAAVPDVATPQLAPPCLVPDVLRRGTPWEPSL